MYKLTDEDMRLIEKAKKITSTDYEIDRNKNNNEELLMYVIEDLLHEIDTLHEKCTSLEDEMHENGEYSSYNPYKDLDISERDFL